MEARNFARHVVREEVNIHTRRTCSRSSSPTKCFVMIKPNVHTHDKCHTTTCDLLLRAHFCRVLLLLLLRRSSSIVIISVCMCSYYVRVRMTAQSALLPHTHAITQVQGKLSDRRQRFTLLCTLTLAMHGINFHTTLFTCARYGVCARMHVQKHSRHRRRRLYGKQKFQHTFVRRLPCAVVVADADVRVLFAI